MGQGGNRFLGKMLDRLLAAIASGPALNCRPHSSRQRVDVAALERLGDIAPAQVLGGLLGPQRSARVVSRVKRPPAAYAQQREQSQPPGADGGADPAEQRWREAQDVLRRLRVIADDARNYEQDTGVWVLNVGYPLLSMARDSNGQQRGEGLPRRLLVPVAMMPVSLVVKGAPVDSVEVRCRGGGVDLVSANYALLAWLEQRTGRPGRELFADERGEEPWREICDCVRAVCEMIEIAVPETFAAAEPGEAPPLATAPRAEELDDEPRIIPAAVLGLFPSSREGLLRDMRAMAEGEPLTGVAPAFVRAGESLEKPVGGRASQQAAAPATKDGQRVFADERPVAPWDPFQREAVRLARQTGGLVIHGPPGTGKSQTLTNIIGDHLARGMRVLMVCDKRTALDVVANRLEHLGLAGLLAVVHDPQRDQRDLYRKVREELENLPQRRTDPSAEARLAMVDAELKTVHDELRQLRAAVMGKGNGRVSLHELIGQWLELIDDTGADASLEEASVEEVDGSAAALCEVFERGLAVEYSANPWRDAVGSDTAAFLARDMGEVRRALDALAEAGAAADRTADARIPPFETGGDVVEEASRRAALAEDLAAAHAHAEREVAQRWAQAEPAAVSAARATLESLEPITRVIRSSPLERELAAQAAASPPRQWMVEQQLRDLEAYLAIADKWHAPLHIGKRRAAAAALRQYGLPFDTAQARRLAAFLNGLRLRLVCQRGLTEAGESGFAAGLAADAAICRAVEENLAVVRALDRARWSRQMYALAARVVGDRSGGAADAIEGLRLSAGRARAIAQVEAAAERAGLFTDALLESLRGALRRGGTAGRTLAAMRQRADTIADVMRLHALVERLPQKMHGGVRRLLREGAAPEAALRAIRRAAICGEIRRRLRSERILQDADARRVERLLERYRDLERRKQALVRDAVLHLWVSRQKQRLLAGTGTRMNSLGTALRQRLLLRGERALRLRQVVNMGLKIEGGDPLFDMCPVWMASPEAVAQIFPRREMFDVVLFDEASQCRLEEALPVLTRARRVVVAGDPQQLPPTRFFETALATSDAETPEGEGDQQLFEWAQSEEEDLLRAALNLQIEQCYLNVHYRSRCEGLIDFSNRYFYESKLQPIPAHPSQRPAESPIRVYRPGGVYDRGVNEAEAEQVCAIVKDLLSRRNPPSIGVACFNVQQRDLIVEKLEEAADADEEFASRLEEARKRRGVNSFEGLFVKNLENVQGDERDHVIISTTYGPDENGRFYRRFGPLGAAGGGRRLNVLVTRAREQVHVVTSIPESEYRSLPPLPPDQAPAGGWLLLAYVKFAEETEAAFRAAAQAEQGGADAGGSAAAPAVRARQTAYPSAFVRALAGMLAGRWGLAADVYWGNDGFCIDVCVRDPQRSGKPWLGVVCDGARFDAADPVEWDVFSDAVHRRQGWRLHRIWTPEFFRDPDRALREIAEAARA